MKLKTRKRKAAAREITKSSKPEPRPMTPEEKAAWEKAGRSLLSLARVNRLATSARWTGRAARESSFGELPEAGGTTLEDFWNRRDDGSV